MNINTLLNPVLEIVGEVASRGVEAGKVLLWGVQEASPEPEPETIELARPDRVINGVGVIMLGSHNTDIYTVIEGPVTGHFSDAENTEAIAYADAEDESVIGFAT